MDNLDYNYISQLFCKLNLSDENKIITVSQINPDLFLIESGQKKYYLNKKSIDQIHYLDDMFEGYNTHNIICPTFKNFEDVLYKLIFFCVNISLINNDNYFKETYLRENDELLTNTLILAVFLDCQELVKLLWIKLIGIKSFGSQQMYEHFAQFINMNYEDKLVKKFASL
ncbi:hypothetical protein Catovirus_1_310 [Catovirus CTV1]|uniref:Uncharacterized protein n=1 Tax=Catovirus CTV1 TaxID=1977631 RepID=A0A1V0S968_9VIRU|nr:hypothetical protein Catovirus_1_310 [Catovirus CTV1]